MDQQDKFILSEYDTATKLIFHVDDLRCKLTTLFLSVTGIGAAGLAILFRGDKIGADGKIIVALFSLMIGVIGIIIVMILGKIRSHQLEHYRICDKIRLYFIKTNYILWNVVEKSGAKRKDGRRGTVPHFWVLIIIVVSSFELCLSLYFFNSIYFDIFKWLNIENAVIIFIIRITLFILFAVIMDALYFHSAKNREEPVYSETSPPWTRV